MYWKGLWNICSSKQGVQVFPIQLSYPPPKTHTCSSHIYFTKRTKKSTKHFYEKDE